MSVLEYTYKIISRICYHTVLCITLLVDHGEQNMWYFQAGLADGIF
jgi:hypothetical protein